MAAKRDYYDVLGISRSADKSTIKRAYRKLAKKYHPDTNAGNAQAEEKFKEATEAYNVLSKLEKKKLYDQFGHAAFDGSAGGSGAYGYGNGPGGGTYSYVLDRMEASMNIIRRRRYGRYPEEYIWRRILGRQRKGSMDLADLEIVAQEGHVRPEEVMKAADSEMDLEIMDSAEKEISGQDGSDVTAEIDVTFDEAAFEEIKSSGCQTNRAVMQQENH